jgi:hypothetical protein
MWAERDLQYITNAKKENKFLCRTGFLGLISAFIQLLFETFLKVTFVWQLNIGLLFHSHLFLNFS